VNTYIGKKIHRATGQSVLPLGTGGLSGPAIQPLALAAVATVCDAVHIPVIGVGGIFDAASARDFLTVGARAVQVGTATFVNPQTALDVLDGLSQ
jgi:dihydroorotate dehydrogenase (NAD+) catalytic subunit